jgi:hypothetical protein
MLFGMPKKECKVELNFREYPNSIPLTRKQSFESRLHKKNLGTEFHACISSMRWFCKKEWNSIYCRLYIPFLASRTTSISRGFHTFFPYLLFYRNRNKLKQNGNIRKNIWNWSRGNSLIWGPHSEGIVKFSVNSYNIFRCTATVQKWTMYPLFQHELGRQLIQ